MNVIHPNTPTHVLLADMLREGMGVSFIRSERHLDHTLVFTTVCKTPIRVERDDIILPDELKSWSPSVMLDVNAFFAENPQLGRPRRRRS